MNKGVNALIFTETMGTPDSIARRGVGAYRIATELRNSGYTCQIIDFFTKFSDEEMQKIENTFIGTDTLIVGFSSSFFEYIDKIAVPWSTAYAHSVFSLNYPYHSSTMDLWIARMRLINPKIRIVLGGSKSQYLLGPADVFAIGYCDRAIVEYLKYLEGKNPFLQFNRLNDAQIELVGSRFPFDFANSTVDYTPADCIQHGEALNIEIGRGCIFKCKFCSFPLNGKKKLDFIKNETVLRDEFLRNYYEHGVTRYVYTDDTHNDSIEKLEKLHKVVNSLPFELEYAAYLRLDLIRAHKETAVLLRESGLRVAAFGIESMNAKTLKTIGKGIHPDQIKETLHWLKDVWKNEVATTAFFIVGLPHETPVSIKETHDWLLDKNCPLDSYTAFPLNLNIGHHEYSLSELERNSAKYGYSLASDDTDDWKNEHFTWKTALEMGAIMNQTNSRARMRVGNFGLICAGNIGFVPKDMIGKTWNEAGYFRDDAIERSKAFRNNYKQRLFDYIELTQNQ